MHKSVLLNECIENLNLKNDSIIVDCTLGYGGHSSNILSKIKNGYLYAFDQDEEAILSSEKRLSEVGSNYKIIYSNFSNLKEKLNELDVDSVDGILFDLGVSSPQLDEADRGFSFHSDARLDMRMDKNNSLSAYEVVNNYSYDDLCRIFYNYGEEKYASGIAKKIVAYRESKPICTTLELVDIIKSGVPLKYSINHHPARKVFQAIRIEVNHELDVFESALKQALSLVRVGGRVCVITFHSLEDKICKNIFREYSEIDSVYKKMPIIPDYAEPKFKLVASIKPSDDEVNLNSRSRSARLRVIERIKEG